MIDKSKLKLSLITNAFVKIISTLVNFLLVPLLLGYLGTERYGVWLTVFSIAGWFTLFDLGLGNGLKLKLTEAFSKRKLKEIKLLISTSYLILGVVVLFLFFILILSPFFLNLEVLFGIVKSPNLDIRFALYFLFSCFILQLFFKLIGVLFSSLQFPFVDGLIGLFGQIAFLLIILIFIEINLLPSYFNIALISAFPLVIIYACLNFWFFLKKAPSLKPNLNFFSKKCGKSIIKPGINFFIIQFCMIILYSTDNLIITNLISASEVTNYSISYKYFGLPFMIFSMFVSTHWPAFISALSSNNITWIKLKLKLFKYLNILLAFVFIVCYFLYEYIVPLWIRNDELKIDLYLNLAMIIYYMISSYATIYIYVINASGKIKLQRIIYLIIAAINIPLSFLFVRVFKLGSPGVILASSLCLLLLLIFMKIQSSKILKGKTIGIWDL